MAMKLPGPHLFLFLSSGPSRLHLADFMQKYAFTNSITCSLCNIKVKVVLLPVVMKLQIVMILLQ